MKKNLLLVWLLFFLLSVNAQNFWRQAAKAEAELSGIKLRTSTPLQQQLYKLDLQAIKLVLVNAPMRGQNSDVILPFPDSEGTIRNFKIYEAPVMHPDLAVKFPDNKSYIGQCIEDRSTVVRFSISMLGLHAMVLAANGKTYYIDPFSNDGNYYIAYARNGLTTTSTFECLTADSEPALPLSEIMASPQDNGVFRTYRTAICCTVEYSAFHITAAGVTFGTLAEKKAAVMAAITTTITRVNSMFERDLSVSFQLVPNNDLLVFIDSDDLTNNDVGALIGEGQTLMQDLIGEANFDFGHTFGTEGGGLGGGSPCVVGQKAIGATGLGSPVGDPWDIDYVAHEMGHQFGAAHTFNNDCGGNRDPNWSYEPGSGSSIMAYAGICAPNIQNNSDAQFFAGSIAQIRNTINGNGGSCAAITSNNNTMPVVSAGTDYTIPKGTAFILNGNATDAENDAMTYTWEQYDKQITTQPPLATATEGPNFKPQVITNVPVRYMPSLSDVLANNLTPMWEVISNVGRDYNFAFTVRDNNINGGESATDFMKVVVSNNAGPFIVTAPNSAVSWVAASNQTVTWDVAGTTGNGVNTPNADILLSTNGGIDFNIILAENVPNDGSQIITVPNIPGTTNRILVRGHNNIFYDVSDQNFTITPSAATFVFDSAGTQTISICQGTDANYIFDYSTISGFTDTTTFSLSGLPANAIATFSPPSITSDGMVSLLINSTLTAPIGFYELTVSAVSGSITKTSTVYLNLLDPDFAVTVPIAPANMATAVALNTTLQWQADLNASAYQISLYLDEALTIPFLTVMSATNSIAITGLSEATTYYWTVQPENAGCEGVVSAAFQFTTGQISCEEYNATDVPVAIPSNSATTVSGTMNVTDAFEIQGITVSLDISHTWVTDMTVTLISPAGTEIVLFSNKCGDQDDVVATFNDAGATLTCSGTPVISGTVKPETLLNTLLGEQSNGVWTLEVYDEFAEDGGFINSWNLNLCSVQPALNLASNEIIEFALYPNPNAGSFTVEMTGIAATGEINIYDMRGRKIYAEKVFAANGTLSETININAEAGMYMFEIVSDGKKNTKKFIIE